MLRAYILIGRPEKVIRRMSEANSADDLEGVESGASQGLIQGLPTRPAARFSPQEQSCHHIPDEHEQFTLQNYVMAIHHLQPHFQGESRAPLPIALIACILFASLDLLRTNALPDGTDAHFQGHQES